MLRLVERFLPGFDSVDTLVECRQCGAKLEEDADCCPECGCSDVAEYRL